jgi:hypothetical protein
LFYINQLINWRTFYRTNRTSPLLKKEILISKAIKTRILFYLDPFPLADPRELCPPDPRLVRSFSKLPSDMLWMSVSVSDRSSIDVDFEAIDCLLSTLLPVLEALKIMEFQFMKLSYDTKNRFSYYFYFVWCTLSNNYWTFL